MELLNHTLVLLLIFGKISILLFIVAVPIYIPTKITQGFPFLYILSNTCYFCVFFFFHNSCFFHFADALFCCVDAFQFDVVTFVIFAFGIKSKEISPKPMSRNLHLCFLLGVLWFQVLCSIFNQFRVEFCALYNIGVQFHSFVLANQFSLYHLLKICHCIFLALCHKVIDHICGDLFLGSIFCSFDLYVLMLMLYYFDYSSFVIQVEIRECDSSCFVHLSQYCFGYLVSYKFQDFSPYFCEKCLWNFDTDYIESVDCFRQHACFNNVNSCNP